MPCDLKTSKGKRYEFEPACMCMDVTHEGCAAQFEHFRGRGWKKIQFVVKSMAHRGAFMEKSNGQNGNKNCSERARPKAGGRRPEVGQQ